ncbi:helix-turn-helix transcriptional regulator [Lihuaxuella thermophila]|uniref:Predicted DNA-binding transcriptional regulator YafY, contains an HTH and WYL domains n=1 Tax=Lihuaxuella thermophila TaxID=1173111 RepID=A0A1H8CUE3_9BACL|nr:YafY family protein [Lihuaxuella thermophila]SEM98064.1 Predicted DNA-binding transcriptional regulator YafY, contains an HTH and WYL domains [Lihuaxuella thermophila]
MSKSQRLLKLLMTVNRKRKFTVKELAREFGVSPRTILRDLQELSEWGVPLYSEVGPHGGYRVLNDRMLPPIAFTEEEAIAIFFASNALRHYSSLPFEAKLSSALTKFYAAMPGDVRDRIDQMKNRVDLVAPTRQAASPHLSILLDAAVHQKVLLMDYESRSGRRTRREIQPVGIYASGGLWYCPAYCFRQKAFRIFRCDRIHGIQESDSGTRPVDLREVHLGNVKSLIHQDQECVRICAELTREGVQRCEAEPWLAPQLHIREDGTGWLDAPFPKTDFPFFARFFIGLGKEATVKGPPELVTCIKRMLAELLDKYS